MRGEGIKASGRRTRLGRVFDVVSWLIAAVLVGASACWLVSGWGWAIDLVANLTAQWLLVGGAAAALWVFTRRWRHAAIGLAACAVGAAGLGAGRAAYWPREIGSRPRATPGLVRVMHYNASAYGSGPEIEESMRLSGADVISIVCPPNRFQEAVVYGKRLEDEYAGKLVRKWKPEVYGDYTEVTSGFVVSKWRLRAVDTGWMGEAANYVIAGIVERPAESGGEFAVVAFHPRSPRTAGRWATGNVTTEAVAGLVTRLRAEGREVAVLADLNSTPTGHRSRLMNSAAGLKRAKPLFSPVGTYPLPISLRERIGPNVRITWPAGIAIDDALISPGIDVVGWSIGPRMSSGHVPVLVELVIGGGGAPTNKRD